MRNILLIAILSSTLAAAQQTSVLFIGNSYTTANDLPNTFRQLALSLGDTVTVASSAPGGYTLYQHSTYAPTLNAIASQPWDFVVMQEQSQLGALPVDATTTELGALSLMADIEANFECTYPVFYMTWGRENGDPQNCGAFPFMCTYDGMQQALRNNYVALANWNDAWTAPVGVAWKNVRDTQAPIDLYVADGSHPTMEGTYLAACVFYCTLFQVSCMDATFNSTLPAETAAILRAIASATVLDEPLTWNLDVPNGTDALLDDYDLGADFVTVVHNGAGEHLWTCTNGQSFTTGTATFTFATAGSYIVTHTYNDPCGNSDTRNFTFDMTVGLDELAARPYYNVVSRSASSVEVQGAENGGTLLLFDAQGRMLVNERIRGSNTQVACPPGLLFWAFTDGNGMLMKGKVVVQ
jgi:hypothetical protein